MWHTLTGFPRRHEGLAAGKENGTKVVGKDLPAGCARAGIARATPNDLRRTYASWMKQARTDSAVVAKLLGHPSTRMVHLVYGRLADENLVAAASALPPVALPDRLNGSWTVAEIGGPLTRLRSGPVRLAVTTRARAPEPSTTSSRWSSSRCTGTRAPGRSRDRRPSWRWRSCCRGTRDSSDSDAVEATVLDLRWQLALNTLGEDEPAFSQGALQEFRERLIAHDKDRRVLERTGEYARKTREFDWKKLPKDPASGDRLEPARGS